MGNNNVIKSYFPTLIIVMIIGRVAGKGGDHLPALRIGVDMTMMTTLTMNIIARMKNG